ncbi:hypothetical protein Tco_1223712, partial [Tanacetum coccineum]
VPPRRPKRRPHPGTSAIQRPSRGRCLLLLLFQAWPAASHPQSPSSGAEQTNLPTPSGIPLTRAAWADALVAFGSSYESPVTEATGPARLFRGPRNENRTRYGTCLWTATTRRPRAAGGDLQPHIKGGPARINRFIPRRGPQGPQDALYKDETGPEARNRAEKGSLFSRSLRLGTRCSASRTAPPKPKPTGHTTAGNRGKPRDPWFPCALS